MAYYDQLPLAGSPQQYGEGQNVMILQDFLNLYVSYHRNLKFLDHNDGCETGSEVPPVTDKAPHFPKATHLSDGKD